MRFIADLHLHGKYARATSKDLTLPMLEKYGRIKGLDILGTGDFQHPEWNAHLKESLTEISGTGIYQTTGGQKFMLQSEISLVFTQGGKGRRVHLVVLAPNFAVVDHITAALKRRGRVDYDGRPIFGMSCVEFVDMMHSISPDIEIIPAHAWTPWFGVFGSKSGFDSLQDCFLDKTNKIHAIETGLSSDPPMNWRLSQLDKVQLISTSDSHSFWPWRIGREATLFDLKEATYDGILKAIRTGEHLTGTIEVNPAYGIYHYDGHRDCKVSYSPAESKAHKGICSKCGKPVTVGVAARAEELADRAEGYTPKNPKYYVDLIPLSELIAGTLGVGLATKKTWAEFNKLIDAFGNEFRILLDASEAELKKVVSSELTDVILKNRLQQITVTPGYDGLYGVPMIGNRVLEVTPEGEHAPHGTQAAQTERSVKKQTGLDRWT
jgi:uncharacterized protein (TIGR00375 family)